MEKRGTEALTCFPSEEKTLSLSTQTEVTAIKSFSDATGCIPYQNK